MAVCGRVLCPRLALSPGDIASGCRSLGQRAHGRWSSEILTNRSTVDPTRSSRLRALTISYFDAPHVHTCGRPTASPTLLMTRPRADGAPASVVGQDPQKAQHCCRTDPLSRRRRRRCPIAKWVPNSATLIKGKPATRPQSRAHLGPVVTDEASRAIDEQRRRQWTIGRCRTLPTRIQRPFYSGGYAGWRPGKTRLSMPLTHMTTGGQGVAGSNPVSPTKTSR